MSTGPEIEDVRMAGVGSRSCGLKRWGVGEMEGLSGPGWL